MSIEYVYICLPNRNKNKPHHYQPDPISSTLIINNPNPHYKLTHQLHSEFRLPNPHVDISQHQTTNTMTKIITILILILMFIKNSVSISIQVNIRGLYRLRRLYCTPLIFWISSRIKIKKMLPLKLTILCIVSIINLWLMNHVLSIISSMLWNNVIIITLIAVVVTIIAYYMATT